MGGEEAQSMEEMGEEHHPLMGPRGGDELPLFGEPHRVVDVGSLESGFLQISEGVPEGSDGLVS